jgi:hypothetical protein
MKEEISRECTMKGEKRNGYRMFVGKPEGKNHLVRLRHR